MPLLKSKPPATEAEETFDLLNLARLNLHPSIAPLFTRREALHQRKANVLEGKERLQAVLTDFEKLHSLALAEGIDTVVLHQWRELKKELGDYDDALELIASGLVEIDQLIDEQTSTTREEVQAEVDRLFLRELPGMIQALEAVVERNNRVHQVENCSSRLLQTGKLYCFNEGLEPWIYGLKRKLNLLSPK